VVPGGGAGGVSCRRSVSMGPSGRRRSLDAARGTPAEPPRRLLTDSADGWCSCTGINVVYKLPPYVAPDTAAGFTARDADFLAAHGFNAVRLGVMFAGVMPQPGRINQGYLTQINRIVQLLTAPARSGSCSTSTRTPSTRNSTARDFRPGRCTTTGCRSSTSAASLQTTKRPRYNSV